MWNHDEIPLLPTTGQTAVYRTGDDGYFKAGRTVARRLRDNGDGTILDRSTGLTWVKQPELIIPGAVGVHATNQAQAARGDWANATAYAKADLAKDTANSTYWVCAVAHTSAAAPATFAQGRSANPTYWRQSEWTASAANLTTPATMAWNAAIDACLALSYAGCDDWRLPNWLELASLYDCSRTGIPLIDQACFPNTVAAQCWSSTTQPYSSSTYAQFVHWAAGYIAISSAIKTTAYYVRPVRGGRTHV